MEVRYTVVFGCHPSSSCSVYKPIRYRTPSAPICLPEVAHKPFALSRIFLLTSEGKSAILVKEKVPSHSGFFPIYIRSLKD